MSMGSLLHSGGQKSYLLAQGTGFLRFSTGSLVVAIAIYVVPSLGFISRKSKICRPGNSYQLVSGRDHAAFRSADQFMTLADVKYNSNTLSFTINAGGRAKTGMTCGKLFFTEKVRMTNKKSGSVASFSTSFTFSIRQGEQSSNRSGWSSLTSGIYFGFLPNSIVFDPVWLKDEMQNPIDIIRATNDSCSAYFSQYFAVEIDTYNNYLDEDPSDNHIGVLLNDLNSNYTTNLCGDQRTRCSFPWTGRIYTTWVEYSASTRSLEVWFSNGSLKEGVTKPAGSALIKASNLDLIDYMDDYMYTALSGCSGQDEDSQEILSWNFASNFVQLVPSSTLSIRSVLKVIHSRIIFVIFLTCIITLVVSCLFRRCRNKKSPRIKFEPTLSHLMTVHEFTFKELQKATDNFNDRNLLGKGGSGSVYKGILTPSSMVVAVKRFTHNSEHVERAFLAELSSISQIRHRNLVHLQGWCHEDAQFLLVFDYMSNGGLDEWLFPSRRRYPNDPKYKKFEVLPWELRFSILAGVAAAVEYLHEEWVQCVLHRDIKSSNVMLDADFNPHLGDFGLARIIDHEKLEKTTMMAGTFGYMAPEMHYTGKATKESDVYSFGVLMLEVLCGRRAVNLQVEDPDEDFMLVQNVWRAYEAGSILSAVDPGLLQLDQLRPSTSSAEMLTNSKDFEAELVDESSFNTISDIAAGASSNGRDKWKIEHLLHLGLHCCLSDPESRPSIRVVKQAIMQVQRSNAGDAKTAFTSMPPLPSTMPVYGSLRNDSLYELRRRFQSSL
ncbi:hypothetical protein KC19_8G046800 [Ceratodon purpureus]|uniref:Protein kinase domain-containing protein n=2 Tax=Ceratodon purpureus TaxID=3225 RepID=A0A8T0GV62_CERPU|nr:hypothetical protein KC19_8G046800 [Ceratodon purpureus]